MTDDIARRMPVGAEVVTGGTRFRVWAPRHHNVEALFEDGLPAFSLDQEDDGYFSGVVESVGPGARYRYRLDGADSYPDPASRFQPDGPHDASEVIDPSGFQWTDRSWGGLSPEGQILYELHVGTFTPEGTWAAAACKLPWLRDIGITAIEVMPVAEFPGCFGWGYDGVQWYAPTRLYGRPDDFRAFVDRAHALGLGVLLDVVYNHLGPDGNYLGCYAPDFFTDRHKTDWGSAINYDGENSGPVRDFVAANAAYWVREFHLDGLRLDATQSIHDDSADHIIAYLARSARAAAGERSIILVAENEPQKVCNVRSPEQGGYGLDMLWNDDFHHSAIVALTKHNEAYYHDYRGNPQEFVSAAKSGFLFQGQWYTWQDARRGTPTRGLNPRSFVNFLENHDQVANSPSGQRCADIAGPGRLRAITALTVLSPGTPMLFQGQEFGSTAPFYYFADHGRDGLGEQVREGRREFMMQFLSVAVPEMSHCVPDPGDPDAFERCRLRWDEAEKNHALVRFHRDLIRLRREDATLRAPKAGSVDGAVLSRDAFTLRYFGASPLEDRLVIVNLGRDLNLRPAPEPLLAAPEGLQWNAVWSTEDPRYGGCGLPMIDAVNGWRIPGDAAVVYRPGPPTRAREGGKPLEHIVRRRNLELVQKGVRRSKSDE